MISKIAAVVGILVVGILQVSFFTSFAAPMSSLDLMLGIIIFLTVIISYEQALWWAFGGGLMLELFTALPFGVTTLSFVLTVILINFLFSNFFTNRSLYSLVVLGFVGTVVRTLIVLLLSVGTSMVGISTTFGAFGFWTVFFWQPLLNLIVLAVIFLTYSISTGRIRNIFLFPTTSYEITRKH